MFRTAGLLLLFAVTARSQALGLVKACERNLQSTVPSATLHVLHNGIVTPDASIQWIILSDDGRVAAVSTKTHVELRSTVDWGLMHFLHRPPSMMPTAVSSGGRFVVFKNTASDTEAGQRRIQVYDVEHGFFRFERATSDPRDADGIDAHFISSNELFVRVDSRLSLYNLEGQQQEPPRQLQELTTPWLRRWEFLPLARAEQLLLFDPTDDLRFFEDVNGKAIVTTPPRLGGGAPPVLEAVRVSSSDRLVLGWGTQGARSFVDVYSAFTKKFLRRFRPNFERVDQTATSPSDDRIAISTPQWTEVYDIANPESPLLRLQHLQTARITQLAWSDDNSLVVINEFGQVMRWLFKLPP